MAPERVPAFQFYPRDFLTDEKQAVMTLEQVGAYIRLLSICWLEQSIPDDPERVARLLGGVTPKRMESIWPAVRCCFSSSDENGRLIHTRLDRERLAQKAWREKSAEGGRKAQRNRKGGSTTVATKVQAPASRLVQPLTDTSSSSSSSSSISSSISTTVRKNGESADALRELWNSTVVRLPKAQKLTEDRKRHALSRLHEEPDLGIWRQVFARLDASDFASGQGGGWRADFDFALKPGTATKVLEGKYDNRDKPTPMMGAGRTAGNLAALEAVLNRERGPHDMERHGERRLLQATGGSGRDDWGTDDAG